MADYVSLTGEVVFNHISKPDVYMGDTRYKITIALDKDGQKTAKKEGLHMDDYKGAKQLTAKRKVDFGEPKIFNASKEEVGVNHLSLFGDKVTIQVKKGKAPYEAYTYIEKVRVDEKAEGVGDFDPAEF